MEKICENCKHWKQKHAKTQRCSGSGFCTGVRFRLYESHVIGWLSALPQGKTCYKLMTNSNFGCVMFEKHNATVTGSEKPEKGIEL